MMRTNIGLESMTEKRIHSKILFLVCLKSILKSYIYFSWVYQSSGKPVKFFFWNRGEPDNLEGEDCVEVDIGKLKYWNDITCNSKRQYICELNRGEYI